MYISGTGMVCSVGHHAAGACAALRAGIMMFDDLPYWDDKVAPVVGAAVPGLDGQFGPRLVEMLARALHDCLSEMPEESLQHIPLIVGLAEPGRPGGGGWFAESIIAHVQERLGSRFHPSLSRVITKGHTAGFEGLRVARELLQAHDVPGCLVCGVDSYINASSLYWLDQHWRLKRENHTDGVIPGEAAAAIYVQLQAPAKTEIKVQVCGLGFALEKAAILSEVPLLAIGLADAGKLALTEAGWGFQDLDFRISDVTGENYGFRELALVEGRLARVVRSEPQPLWHAVDSIGDTGAAAGLVQMVWARAAWTRGYAPGARAACFSSAVPGDRAVALLQCYEV